MATRPEPADVGALPLFMGLSEEEHATLASFSHVEELAPGTTVFDEGDPPGDLYVMLEGRVTLCMRIPGQPDTCFLSLRSGELLGGSALLHRPRAATARVMQATRLLRLEASKLLELCETDHHVGYQIMRQAFEEMADRLHSTRIQLVDMFGKPGS